MEARCKAAAAPEARSKASPPVGSGASSSGNPFRQEVWSTVSAFVIDTRSIRGLSDSVSAVRAMSAVSKELAIMVQDTCESAYKQHEVWQMVIPFAVEAWHWCCICVKDKDEH